MTVFEITLRLVCLTLALPVIWLSWRGFIAFGMGDQWIDNGFKAVSFLVAVSIIGFQIVNLGLPRTSETLMLPLVTMIAALGVALTKLVHMRSEHFNELEKISKHLDVAMAIVDLARISHDDAKMLADKARSLVAEHRFNRVKGPGDDYS